MAVLAAIYILVMPAGVAIRVSISVAVLGLLPVLGLVSAVTVVRLVRDAGAQRQDRKD